MKNKLFIYSLLLFANFQFPTPNSHSQSTATIGTATVTNTTWQYPAPYGNFYWGAKHQILVRASELTGAGMAAGNITALGFDVSVPGGAALTGFTIRIKSTAATTTGPTFDNAGFTSVYGPQTFTDVAGWNTHTFATPFYWNGTSNLLIETCFNNANWTQNAQMKFTATTYNSVTHYFNDITTVCSSPNGTVSMNRPNLKFTFTPNGPPTSLFIGNPTATCSGNVSFTDQSYYAITSRLWNFGDGGTSTAQNPTHTYTATGTYSVSLMVTNANGNNTLVKPNYISVNLGSGPMPAACTPTTTAYCCGFGITNFKFHLINNTSADASEGYADFSCGLDTVTTGQSYNISVSTLAPATHNVRCWIDFNNDGTFNPTGELVFTADNSSLATGTVFIPGTATLSTPLRLRVAADHSLNPAPTPCGSIQFGQGEDYAIYIKPNTNPPAAQFKADDTLSCSGLVNFTDQSQNVPMSWLWNFGDGGTSTSQNPSHTYTANGTYSVSLMATNANGNNTLVKTNYIDVTLGNIPIAAACQPSTFSYCCNYGIYKVQLGSINKSSPDASEGYRDFSCTSQATLVEGQSYSISIQTNPSNVQDTKVWIDFNNDGAFTQANELVFTALNAINPTGNISIPIGAAPLNTLIRMRVSSDNGGSNPGSCTALIRGQAEDYGVKILQVIGVPEAGDNGQGIVSIYPNPFSETAVVAVIPPSKGGTPPSAGRGDVLFLMYDLLGRPVKQQPIVNNQTTIERGSLKAGIYFYKVMVGEEMVGAGKIIIQ